MSTFFFLFLCAVSVVLLGFLLWNLFMIVRIEVVYKIRARAIDEDIEAYLSGPEWDAMLHAYTRWRYEDFYPKKES